MQSTQRIALLLVFVFFIPVMFFSFYELSSLNEEERMIGDIYNKQLETILFSVNQYSDDVLSSWVARVETDLNGEMSDSVPGNIQNLLELNASLLAIVVADTMEGSMVLKGYFQEDVAHQPMKELVKAALEHNIDGVRRLVAYKRKGFQKIEPLAEIAGLSSPEGKAMAFISEREGRFRVVSLILAPQLFIDDVIGPRLQTISRDQFVLSAIAKKNDSIVYSTALRTDSLAQATAIKKDFWVFPEYAIGIYLNGDGIEQLITERSKVNMILLVALIVVLVVALVLVFRNLKKEVDLAQNKADFVSNVSHELRTPLALISMFAETLEMNRIQSEEKKQEYYHILSKETQRLTRIVNKILNFSQAEAKKKNLRIERLNMKPEIQAVLDIYDYHLRSRGFTYSFDCPGVLWLRADKEALIESFINLLDNAIKYSGDVKEITITSGKADAFAFLSVQDSGIGISAKDQHYIFDKFYRVPKGNLARIRGTGLGLALVKQLVEEQKGKVSVKSELGKGSTFTLYYPLD